MKSHQRTLSDHLEAREEPRLAGMTLHAREYDEAGLGLPPSVRKDVASRLLESVEVVDDESIQAAWKREVTSASWPASTPSRR